MGDRGTEKVRHRRRGYVGSGGGHPSHAEGVLDGPQQRVVVVEGRRRQGRRPAGRDEQGGYLVHAREVVLIPGDDEERVLARECGAAKELRYLVLEPRVAGGDRAVMHVVAQIWCDEAEVGRGPRGEISRELGVRDDVRAALRDVGLHVREVDKRVVLGRVATAR